MGLNVTLEVNKTELLVKEQPICVLTLENDGSDPVEIVHPDCEQGMPCFRVIQVDTGAETFVRSPSRRGAEPDMVEIPARGQVRLYLDLLNRVDLRIPAEYAVSVVYFYNGNKDQAESAPVRLKIRPLAASRLELHSVRGGCIDAVFLNPIVDPADVVVTDFRIIQEGGAGDVSPVGKAPLLSRPRISSPPNKKVGAGVWVAWFEKNELMYVHFEPDQGATATGRLKIRTLPAAIVPPLYIAAREGGQENTNGAVLLWTGGIEGAASTLQVVEVDRSADKARAKLTGKVEVAGARPDWMKSHVRSDGNKYVAFLRSSGETVGLHLTAWPDGMTPSIGVQKLMDLKGRPVTSDSTINLEDEICGATLLWTGPEEQCTLELVGWRIGTRGKAHETYREKIPWSQHVPVGAAVIRVRPSGTPAMLIRPNDYQWSVWHGFKKELVPVPEPYTDTKRPIDIAFLNATDVVLICAETVGGFSVKQLDGSDLPPFPS